MILRSEKGSPLTFDEMDGNFRELTLEIQKLKDIIAMLQTHGNMDFQMEQVGSEVTFRSPLGKILGVITLPQIKPHVRGLWRAGVNYKPFDWITEEGRTYSCIKPHISHEFHKEKLSHWEIVIDPISKDQEESHV